MQTDEARISRDKKYVQVIPVENSEALTIIIVGDDQQDTCSAEIPTNTSNTSSRGKP
ncbi:MAG TPA: hypothetical protein VF043_01910 [Ktedonobacteraceae bacterium]